jgi:hypothetical protein
MLPKLQIGNPPNPIRGCHPAHPGHQSLQILPLQELDPLCDCGLLVVVPVEAQEVDGGGDGLKQDRAPEGDGRFGGLLVVAQGGEVRGET